MAIATPHNLSEAVVDRIFAMAMMTLRENAVFSRYVLQNFSSAVAQQGDTISVRIPSAKTTSEVRPQANMTEPAGTVAKTVDIKIDTWRSSSIGMTDKEMYEIAEGKMGFLNTESGECIKALVNEIDIKIWKEIYQHSNKYTGTIGSTPFAQPSDSSAALSDAINARRELVKALTPPSNRALFIDPAAEASALGNRAIQDASYRNNSPDSLVSGMLGRIMGFDWVCNQNITKHTSGTGAKTASAAAAVGATEVTTGSTGTFKKGDLISFGGSALAEPFYTVVDDVATGASQTLKINEPLSAAVANNAAIHKLADHVPNVAFHNSAVAFVSRAVTARQDFTGGHMYRTGVDNVSGITLTLGVFRQHYQTKWEWSVLYGCAPVRPELSVRVVG